MNIVNQQAYSVIYRFERVTAAEPQYISSQLNAWLRDGWAVVSHAQDTEEYSFVLKKSVPQQGY